MDNTVTSNIESTVAARKRWEEPRIVLERSLLVSAQEGDPGSAPIPGAPGGPHGFLGPLGTSGGPGTCGDPQ